MPCLIWSVIVLSSIVCYHMVSGWICVHAIYTKELESYTVVELMSYLLSLFCIHISL